MSLARARPSPGLTTPRASLPVKARVRRVCPRRGRRGSAPLMRGRGRRTRRSPGTRCRSAPPRHRASSAAATPTRVGDPARGDHRRLDGIDGRRDQRHRSHQQPLRRGPRNATRCPPASKPLATIASTPASSKGDGFLDRDRRPDGRDSAPRDRPTSDVELTEIPSTKLERGRSGGEDRVPARVPRTSSRSASGNVSGGETPPRPHTTAATARPPRRSAHRVELVLRDVVASRPRG